MWATILKGISFGVGKIAGKAVEGTVNRYMVYRLGKKAIEAFQELNYKERFQK